MVVLVVSSILSPKEAVLGFANPAVVTVGAMFVVSKGMMRTGGVDPKPFIIGICFGASACFASPMGYQTNLMVFGPGGYTF